MTENAMVAGCWPYNQPWPPGSDAEEDEEEEEDDDEPE